MRRGRFWRTTVAVAFMATIAVAVVFGVAAAAGRNPTPRCTHGLSSIGPVEIQNGRLVGGDPEPHTEACLP
jgi:hypothetical protein